MDESTRVEERLERIEALDRSAVPPSLLLDELRALVVEAEAWARSESGARARAAAAAKLREEAEGMS